MDNKDELIRKQREKIEELEKLLAKQAAGKLDNTLKEFISDIGPGVKGMHAQVELLKKTANELQAFATKVSKMDAEALSVLMQIKK